MNRQVDDLSEEKAALQQDVEIGKQSVQASENRVETLEKDLGDAHERIKTEQAQKNQILETLRKSEACCVKVSAL